MLQLPKYADNKIGRALISELIASPPESHIVRDDWGQRDTPHFTGKPAAMLRRLHDEWVSRQFAVLDAQFAVSGVWDQAASDAIFRVEQPDGLIARLLAEPQTVARAA